MEMVDCDLTSRTLGDKQRNEYRKGKNKRTKSREKVAMHGGSMSKTGMLEGDTA